MLFTAVMSTNQIYRRLPVSASLWHHATTELAVDIMMMMTMTTMKKCPERPTHCALTVARQSQKFMSRCRPPS